MTQNCIGRIGLHRSPTQYRKIGFFLGRLGHLVHLCNLCKPTERLYLVSYADEPRKPGERPTGQHMSR
jgi:hypothetical protein